MEAVRQDCVDHGYWCYRADWRSERITRHCLFLTIFVEPSHSNRALDGLCGRGLGGTGRAPKVKVVEGERLVGRSNDERGCAICELLDGGSDQSASCVSSLVLACPVFTLADLLGGVLLATPPTATAPVVALLQALYVRPL